MDKDILIKIIDFIPEPTFAIDNNKRVIACNKAIEKALGVARDEIIGRDCRDYSYIVYGERRPLFAELILDDNVNHQGYFKDIIKRDDVLYGETFIPSINGKGRCVMVMASALRDKKGRIIGVMETLRDITEKKEYEDTLRKSEEKYKNIYENAIEGMYQSTPDGKYISINPAMAYMIALRIWFFLSPILQYRFMQTLRKERFIK